MTESNDQFATNGGPDSLIRGLCGEPVAFKPDYMGQLHTYVNWYRENMMEEYDQPPIGILLCTGKSEMPGQIRNGGTG